MSASTTGPVPSPLDLPSLPIATEKVGKILPDAFHRSSITDIESNTVTAKLDIEHQPVTDDPRLWSSAFKWTLVAILSAGALIPTMAANIFFPVINDLKADLHASNSSVALSISLYILAQGGLPLVWSPISEIIGRKKCFLAATAIFTVSMIIIAAATQNVGMLIAFRVIGAGGSSAMLAIAAGTLADLYEPAERGVKVGIYYSCPLIGPALGPIFGGAFGGTGRGAWRLTFYFMGACGAASFVSFIFFKETFRTERSLAWQKARVGALERAAVVEINESDNRPSHGVRGMFSRWEHTLSVQLHDGGQKIAKLLYWRSSGVEQSTEAGNAAKRQVDALTSSNAAFLPPLYQDSNHAVQRTSSAPVGLLSKKQSHLNRSRTDRSARVQEKPSLTRKVTTRGSINRIITNEGREIKFRPKLSDVSPLGSAMAVVKQPHNLAALFYSGLAFASQYSLSYTASRTFSAAPYNFSPILIGVVLLALGIGGMVGSVLGGRLSDRALRIGSEKLNGQRAAPELRIMSVRLPMLLCPATFVGYAWSAHYKINIAVPVVCLVLLGFSLFWIYSAALTYLVDSNTGRSSGAVACNSALRGLFAFIASEVAGPIQDAVGDGPLYTGWAILLCIGQLGLLTVAYKGQAWRDPDWKWPRLPLKRRCNRLQETDVATDVLEQSHSGSDSAAMHGSRKEVSKQEKQVL
ncbi:hypothetical protein CBS101457_003360 [Exobasidium rhododendri]|nr:hypothetical protein CBS101457_003360 [Exobasidium rhododendri]